MKYDRMHPCNVCLRRDDGARFVFRILFNNTLKHEDEGFTRIPMEGIDSSTMELILQYIYTRQMDVDCDNVLEVMRVADYLHIDGLVQLCHVFVVECLATENCVDLLQFAKYATADGRRHAVVRPSVFTCNRVVRLFLCAASVTTISRSCGTSRTGTSSRIS